MNNCIVTTSWDDGCEIDERLASLLTKYNIKGTFYIPQTFEGNTTNPNTVLELDKNFEIGAHTISHVNLLNVDLERAYQEISNSKRWLDELLEHKIHLFSFPSGKYNNVLLQLAKKAGYQVCRTLDFQITLPKDPFVLGVGPQASNGSPLLRLKASFSSTFSVQSLFDWTTNARLLFDHLQEEGGVFHLWGHSWEIQKNNDWRRLESLLQHISKRKNVSYLTNFEVIESRTTKKDLLVE